MTNRKLYKNAVSKRPFCSAADCYVAINLTVLIHVIVCVVVVIIITVILSLVLFNGEGEMNSEGYCDWL
jgi:type III secretory pathway component EscU